MKFQRGVVRLYPGDVLVAMTDGIFDRRSKAGEFFGETRLRRLVQESKDDASTLLARIFSEALAFGDQRPWEDDATAIVIRRLEPPPAASG